MREPAAESFLSSARKARFRKQIYQAGSLPSADVFDCVEMSCNQTRGAGHFGGINPEACEVTSNCGLEVFMKQGEV